MSRKPARRPEARRAEIRHAPVRPDARVPLLGRERERVRRQRDADAGAARLGSDRGRREVQRLVVVRIRVQRQRARRRAVALGDEVPDVVALERLDPVLPVRVRRRAARRRTTATPPARRGSAVDRASRSRDRPDRRAGSSRPAVDRARRRSRASPYACICAKPSRYHGSSASASAPTIAKCSGGQRRRLRGVLAADRLGIAACASRKTHGPRPHGRRRRRGDRWPLPASAPDDSVGRMSPKTLTGVELDLDDAPARDSELFLVDGNNLAYRAYLRAAGGARDDRGLPDERAARLHEHALQAARRLQAEGRRRRLGHAAGAPARDRRGGRRRLQGRPPADGRPARASSSRTSARSSRRSATATSSSRAGRPTT